MSQLVGDPVLTPAQRRALMRRKRLQQNADERMKSIFTKSGLPPPSSSPSLPVEQAKPVVVPDSVVEQNIVDVPRHVDVPRTKKEGESPRQQRLKDERLKNLQKVEEASDSIAQAKKRAQIAPTSSSDHWKHVRMLSTFLLSLIFVIMDYNPNVLIAFILCDATLCIYSLQKKEKPSLISAMLGRTKKLYDMVKGIMTMFSMICLFYFIVVITEELRLRDLLRILN